MGLDNSDFWGGRELGAVVASAPSAAHCLVERTWTWLLGRTIVEEDLGLLDALTNDFGSDGRIMKELLVRIVTSEPFRTIDTTDSDNGGAP